MGKSDEVRTLSFLKSIAKGKIAENLSTELFTKHGFIVKENDARKKKKLLSWDLKIQGHDFTFKAEVKYDIMAEKTRNIAIEYMNVESVTESGILATKADVWLTVLKEKKEHSVWLSSTSKLLYFFLTNKKCRDIPVGGDNNAAMKLWEKSLILDSVFARIDTVSQQDILDLLKKEIIHCHRSFWNPSCA